MAEVLLDVRGLSFSSHKAVISAFGQFFAKTGELDQAFHHLLIVSFEKRQMGDYLAETSFSETEVEDLLKRAEAFLDAGTAWLAGK